MNHFIQGNGKWHSLYLAVPVGLLLAVFSPYSLMAQSADLNEEEVALLKELDNETLTAIVELVEVSRDLKATYESLREGANAEAGDDEEDVPDEISEAKRWVEQVDQLLTRHSDKVQKYFDLSGIKQKAQTRFEEVRTELQNVPFDAAEQFDLTEQEYREELAELAGVNDEQLWELTAEIYYEEVFAKIEQARNPAEYFRNFLYAKLKDWIEKPLALDDSDEIVFQVVMPDNPTSVFNPDGGIAIKLQYVPGDIEVWATGFYFEYVPGQAMPRPVLDKLKIDDRRSVSASAALTIRELGNELLNELAKGSAFRVKITQMPDLVNLAAGKKAGAIGLKVEFNWTQFSGGSGSPVIAECENVLLYPGNKVDLNDSTITIIYKSDVPIVIPPGVLAFWEFGGSITPSTKRLCGKTAISTTATPARETIGLFMDLCTAPPFERFELIGDMRVRYDYVMATMQGELDFSKGIIKGTYEGGLGTGNNPLSEFACGTGSFELKSEHLKMQGRMKLLRQDIAELDAIVRFSDQSAELYGRAGIDLFGTDFGANLTGEIKSGFSQMSLGMVQSITVTDVPPFGTVDASVNIRVETGSDSPVVVEVDTFMPGLDFTLRLQSLDECNLALLEKEIRERAVEGYQQLLEELANLDKQTRELAAELDHKVREEIDKKFGITWRTGNKDLDRIGGELSNVREQTGKSLSNIREEGGKIVTGVKDGIGDLGESTNNLLTSISGGGVSVPW